MNGIVVPVPERAQQQKLMDYITSCLSHQAGLAQALNRQIALLAERRQALITAAVTGQIDVTTARGVDVS